jgi:hypothetical protein
MRIQMLVVRTVVGTPLAILRSEINLVTHRRVAHTAEAHGRGHSGIWVCQQEEEKYGTRPLGTF